LHIAIDAACGCLNLGHSVANIAGLLYDHGHVAIDTVCNLQYFRHGHAKFLSREYVQLLKRILNVRPAHQPLQKSFYFMIDQTSKSCQMNLTH
jgi:hypothetical protein